MSKAQENLRKKAIRVCELIADLVDPSCGMINDSVYQKACKLSEEVLALRDSLETASGAEIYEFWEEKWPDDYYYELEGGIDPVDDGGNFVLEEDKIYDLHDFGFLAWHSSSRCSKEECEIDFCDAFIEAMREEKDR